MKNKFVRSTPSIDTPMNATAAFSKISLRVILVATALLLGVLSAGATNWYVRPGGAGSTSGADWNNAWSVGGIGWSSVKPGDTIWLAGGTYNDTLSVAASGTSSAYITIERVRSTDTVPASAAGWSSSFDSQVIVNGNGGLPCTWLGSGTLGSYIYMDGRVDSGISFQLANVSSSVASFPGAVYFGAGCSGTAFVTFTNIEMCGPVPSNSVTYSFNSSLTALSFYGGPCGGCAIYVTDLTVTHCRMHGALQIVQLVGVARCVFDHCQMYDLPFDSGPNGYHQNVIEWALSGPVTVRYCQWYNWYGEGCKMGNTQYEIPEGPCYMYGNLFFNPNSGAYAARIVEAREGTQTLYFYNNTCVNMPMCNAVSASSGDAPGEGQWSSSSQSREQHLFEL